MGTTAPYELFNLTVSDLVIIALMVLVFVLAIWLPYPGSKGEPKS